MLIFNFDIWGLHEHKAYDIDKSQPLPSTTVTSGGAGLSYPMYIAVWTLMPAVLLIVYFIFHTLAPKWVGVGGLCLHRCNQDFNPFIFISLPSILCFVSILHRLRQSPIANPLLQAHPPPFLNWQAVPNSVLRP
jgi:hypothetical protein